MILIRKTLLSLGLAGVLCANASADSIWERRDPRTAYLFIDYRARSVGDLLTLVVNETTEFEGMEKREMERKTDTSAGWKFSGKTASDNVSRNFTGEFDGRGVSGRKFDGKANATIDRRFLDRMTVTVVGVMPNGNLIIEGYRKRTVSREVRLLRVTGIVRPADIGPFNTVQSQYIGDFDVTYMGRGPESSYSNQGWWGRMLNKVWPY
jgi:flagellar L-ring protein precursor FlgH